MALQLIREQFPNLSAKNIRLLGSGWDNTAFIIDEELIFRFPRREIALPLLEAEWCALPKLASRLPVPIPIPQWKGSPTSHFPWPFIGYRLISGFTACYANLLEEGRAALAEPIAQFLARLHATPKSEISECHLPENNQFRIDGTLLTTKIGKNFEELSLLGLLENRKKLEDVVQNLQHFKAPVNSFLVHGDFYVRHLLVNQKHDLVGVIDWGDVHWGDPAIDLAIAHSFLPVQAHKSFRTAYGEITEETWALAKLRAIYSSTLLTLFGYHSDDPNIMREGLRSLKVMSME
ncbi:phosphotransferase [Candidatus Protochlamydia phocaeensis]|uniref:phosphotransferase n=1 Tax=Candidatus Protochlamydia phocaeensis TaxID=1414722 RepID=UPI0018964222|nr:phosphotransferase [Candidatus Protochlamydia phocaeensis]